MSGRSLLLPIWLLVVLATLPVVAHAQIAGTPRASGTTPGLATLGVSGGAALYSDPRFPIAPGAFQATTPAALGAELTTNGSFTGGLTGWTAGTGWAYNSGTAVWTAGSAGTLAQTVSVVSGTTYLLTWDQNNSNPTNGTITPSLGSVGGLPLNFLITGNAPGNQEVLVANATGSVSLSFAAAAVGGVAGSITLANVSLKALTPASPTLQLRNIGGGVDLPFYPGGSGADNFFAGTGSGQFDIGSAYQNAGSGAHALGALTSGNTNAAFGANTLVKNTIGNGNLALGFQALYSNIMGHENVAVGKNSMVSLTTGSENTAIGTSSLENLTTGWDNHADGNGALASVVTGSENTAVGENALGAVEGAYNVVVGWNADFNYAACTSTTCAQYYNTVMGFQAGTSITTGGSNLILGANVAPSLTSGGSNIVIGTSNSVDVVTPTTTGYLNIGNIIKATGITTPSSAAISLSGPVTVPSLITPIVTSTSGVNINTQYGTQLQVADQSATSANFVYVKGSPTGTPTLVSTYGSDSNIVLQMQGRGNLGVTLGVFSIGRDPISSDFGANLCALWINTSIPTTKLVCNVGGTIRSSAALS